MRIHRVALGALVSVSLAACDQPTAPAVETVDDAVVAQLAEEVSESSDLHLPSLGALLRASRDAIHATDGGNPEAVRHFRAARHLAVASEDSLAAGNEEAARRLARGSYRHTLQGIVTALGEPAVAEAVAASAAGLTRIEARLEGRDVPERITKRVARIGELVAGGQVHLAAGEPVAALHQALAAAEAIRHLSPRYLARRWIRTATELLRGAIAAVGDAPTEEEARALRRAHRLLAVARDELAAGRPLRAAEAARRSARLSGGVLHGRAGGGG
jgi:hypothetical protein